MFALQNCTQEELCRKKHHKDIMSRMGQHENSLKYFKLGGGGEQWVQRRGDLVIS